MREQRLVFGEDAEMAAAAIGNCAASPGVHFEITSFEGWPVRPAGFDLVFSAQAWHWVDLAVRCRKAADALVAHGTLALLWHRTAWAGEPLRDELDALYAAWPQICANTIPASPGWTRSAQSLR